VLPEAQTCQACQKILIRIVCFGRLHPQFGQEQDMQGIILPGRFLTFLKSP